jgi:hypothetical protein
VLRDVDYVLKKLDWMRAERIWPNGLRYLWTDAFGVVLYISRYREPGESRWLGEAERVVAEVERVLGARAGCASAKLAIAMAVFSLSRDVALRVGAAG